MFKYEKENNNHLRPKNNENQAANEVARRHRHKVLEIHTSENDPLLFYCDTRAMHHNPFPQTYTRFHLPEHHFDSDSN